MRRAIKIALIVLGSAAALVVALFVAALLFVDLDKLVNDQIAKARPDLEQRLGRKLAVGRVSTRVFPTLGGRVEGVSIAADPAHKEDDRPLLKIGSVGFDVALLKAVLTLGRSIEVKEIALDGLSVSLVRYPDGRLSYQDIVDRQPKAAPPQGPAPAEEPLSPEVQKILRAVSIDVVRVGGAEVRLVDYQTATGQPAESLIRKLNLNLKDVRLKDPIGIRLDAAVFSEEKNLELETSVGPLPADLKLRGAPRLGGLKLRATGLDLSRIAPYLPKTGPRIDAAKLSADLSVGAMDGARPFDVSGFLGLSGLQFRGGEAFDVRADAKLKVDGDATGAEIEKLDLSVGKVKLSMAGALKELAGTPKFKDFTVRSTTLDPAALLSYYPEGKASLPKGLKLAGAATLEVKASGDAQRQTVKADLDMAALDVLYPDALLKPPGTALALHVDGDFTATDAQLRRLGLELDELDLDLAGSVKGFKAPQLDLTLSAKPFSFDRLVRLLPSAHASLAAAQAKAEGSGKLEGHLRGSAESLDAALELMLVGCKLDVPAARVDGDLRLSVAARGNPKKDLAATLDFDADKAVVKVPGRIDKAASTPWRMHASVLRRGDRLDVQKFEVRFAELALTAVGGFNLATQATDLKIDMPRLDLEKFARTVTAIPARQAKAGFVDAKLALRGSPEKLESMQLVLKPFNARLGKSDLAGELTVQNPARPQVEMVLRSNLLDLDELSPPAGGPKAKGAPTGPAAPEVDDPSLKGYRLAGAVDLKKVILRGDEISDFRGRVRLENGVLTLEDCTFKMYDGVVTAKGTEAEIWKGRMPFKANLSVKGVDVNKALASKTRYGGALQGKADFDTSLSGEGFQTEELEQKLLGNMVLGVTQGKLERGNLTDAVLGDFKALEKVPGLSLKQVKSENNIKDLAAHFEVKDGKMALTRPMTFSLDGNRVALGGAIGIAGGLFLQGDYFVSAGLLEKATGGRCKSSEEVRVPLSIGGTAAAPQVRPDGKAIALTLAQKCLAGAAGGKLLNTLGLGSSSPAAPAEAAKAPAPAGAAAPDAAANAKADADKKARDALEAQKKKAADALKGLFGK